MAPSAFVFGPGRIPSEQSEQISQQPTHIHYTLLLCLLSSQKVKGIYSLLLKLVFKSLASLLPLEMNQRCHLGLFTDVIYPLHQGEAYRNSMWRVNQSAEYSLCSPAPGAVHEGLPTLLSLCVVLSREEPFQIEPTRDHQQYLYPLHSLKPHMTSLWGCFFSLSFLPLVWGSVQKRGHRCSQWHQGGGADVAGQDGREAGKSKN